METKILSLDLGSNSIGATIRNLNEENQFEKTTVVTFNKGVGSEKGIEFSFAAERTKHRSIRRLYQARKYKLWSVLEILSKDNKYCPISEESLRRWKHYDGEKALKGEGGRKYPVEDIAFANWIKLDFNNDGIPDYTSPYQLREELATVKLDLSLQENRFKIGRALYHIAQHRGFKSSKKVQNKDEENKESENQEENNIGAEGKKEPKFYKAIEDLKIDINKDLPVGVALAVIERDGIRNENRKTEGIRIRKELHQYVTRKMLIREVDYIFQFQGISFGSIFKDKKGIELKINRSPIFWQRPLRSQKGLVGKCTLEPSKYRCPASRPEFEKFRALSFINNIYYKPKNEKEAEWKQLEPDLRKQLFEEKFFVQKDFEFLGIYRWLQKKNGHDNWELNYHPKTNVSACIVSARLQNIFGDKWNSTVSKTDKNGKEIKQPFYEEIWHVLFESDDEDFIREYGETKLKLEPEQLKKLVSLWYAMPVAYAQLSLKAINNMLPFLRQGYIYTEAALLAKVPEVIGEKIWNESKDFITSSLKKDVIEANRYEKKLLNIANNLIAQYKALPENEKFAERNFNYGLGEKDSKLPKDSSLRDEIQITNAIEESFGKKWKEKDEADKQGIIQTVRNEYQNFFNDEERRFKKLPHLLDSMKQFLTDNFDFLQCKNPNEKNERCNKCESCRRVNKLYHPSQIEIYPPAKEQFYDAHGIEKRLVLLGSPKTGAFKNPMAMRALHELRKFVNYLIASDQIDEETRIVVEIPREGNLDDSNRRYAYTVYQRRREEENKEFAAAILELLKDPEAKGSLADANNDSDIDKFRLWYEMIEDIEGYEDKGKFIENTKKEVDPPKKSRKKKQVVTDSEEEEKFYEFEENIYEKINKSLYFKLKKAKDNVIEKYRLWKEQNYFCIYTGNPIKITDLFKENLIDFEHTLPRSISFDNSLANKTVCYADYNRNVKKNQIPFDLPNYAHDETVTGKVYSAIEPRLEKWKQKVTDLELHVEFWKAQSKRASTPDRKNKCIRQKHLWQFELNYWKNKVERFTIDEVKPGFKNSQLKDTQIISKYAFHYLKTFFNKVDVQKGSVTAEFRKIFGIQQIGTEKDRSKHSHHAKDAIILSLIPVAAVRDNILRTWYQVDELNQLLKSDTEKDKNKIRDEISHFQEQLRELIKQCRLPNVNSAIDQVDEQILINNIAKDQSLTPAKRKRKIIYYDKAGNKKVIERKITGDAIRGQLHKDSYLGAIRLVKKDERGEWIKNEEGKFEFEELKYVIREELVYKKNDQSPGFKDLEDLKDQIIDKHLFDIIKKQVIEAGGDFKEALNKGIWMLDKKGNKVNKIRRVRIEVRTKNAVPLKLHSHKSETLSKILPDRKHKENYWVNNGENIICALYQKAIKDKKGKDKIDRELEIITLNDAADLLSLNKKREIELYRKDNEGLPEKPYALLKSGMKVIFYEKELNELTQLENKELNKRTYTIIKFSGGRITFGHHLDARSGSELKKAANEKADKSYATGYSKVDIHNPQPRLLLSKDSLNMAIEDLHFKIKPDGELKLNLDHLGNIQPINAVTEKHHLAVSPNLKVEMPEPKLKKADAKEEI